MALFSDLWIFCNLILLGREAQTFRFWTFLFVPWIKCIWLNRPNLLNVWILLVMFTKHASRCFNSYFFGKSVLWKHVFFKSELLRFVELIQSLRVRCFWRWCDLADPNSFPAKPQCLPTPKQTTLLHFHASFVRLENSAVILYNPQVVLTFTYLHTATQLQIG